MTRQTSVPSDRASGVSSSVAATPARVLSTDADAEPRARHGVPFPLGGSEGIDVTDGGVWLAKVFAHQPLVGNYQISLAFRGPVRPLRPLVARSGDVRASRSLEGKPDGTALAIVRVPLAYLNMEPPYVIRAARGGRS